MKVVLDANVLFPTILREILIDVAGSGLFTPIWSQRILDEWRLAAERLGPEQGVIAAGEIAVLTACFPLAAVRDDGDRLIDWDLPDPADRHVIESALAGGAETIVTANLRDFPGYLMRRAGVAAVHPDAFLLGLAGMDRMTISNAVVRAHEKAVTMGGQISLTQMLKRSRLPRLAKSMKG
ncbi:PIN domain-containing protein [Paracoccus sp. Z330]|uniref:PIN domain-containing protein n=1 Tax=Paracoccus onchidii TaxID=3017813 RepID=A0ABT4ZEJ9_9RHOB|nr:PIN domain-containing protein [Paracoccus onchidii]MDB6177794.1 PIN domain-containing protein [Paracoccus onchidii]